MRPETMSRAGAARGCGGGGGSWRRAAAGGAGAAVVTDLFAEGEAIAEGHLGGEAVGERVFLDVDDQRSVHVEVAEPVVGEDGDVAGAADLLLRRPDVVVGEEVRGGAFAAALAEDEAPRHRPPRRTHALDDGERRGGEGDGHPGKRPASKLVTGGIEERA